MGEFKRGYLYARAMYSSTHRDTVPYDVFQEADFFMARFLHHWCAALSRRNYCHLLAFCWTAGLGCGIFSWFRADDSISSLMRSTLGGSVSIVSLLCVTGLPFLLSALAVFLSGTWLLPGISFGKGFVYSFISMGVLSSFGSSGWLFQPLLCFSDFLGLPLLYWFWLRCIRSPEDGDGCRVLLTGALLFLIGSVDFCVVAPFLADLINL